MVPTEEMTKRNRKVEMMKRKQMSTLTPVMSSQNVDGYIVLMNEGLWFLPSVYKYKKGGGLGQGNSQP